MNIYPWIGLAVAILALWKCQVFTKVILPAAVGLVVVCLWQLACDHLLSETNPTPGQTLAAIFEIDDNGRLWSDAAASLFRVTWGFFLAALVGIPLGLWVGWTTR
ncbi:MAG: NitT/TauT family transport system permease protein, partial [Gammaproteobacteria bacterium]